VQADRLVTIQENSVIVTSEQFPAGRGPR
jgi:hypothetical protein